jgi:ABC-type antimicrobial peptide transport system permease subunit
LPIASGVIEGRIAGPIIVFGILMAAVVGLLGGSYPAFRAAGLPPSHGLRSE